MSEKNPLVSVIMNCHNGEKYLDQSVKSIIDQTYSNWELIFWDNQSTDNSKKIIHKFTDDRIKYFKSENFKKLYESRNLAIQKAQGKFVSFLDTDDMWVQDKIEKQVNFLEQNTDYEIVYSNYYILDEFKKKKFAMFKNKLTSGIIINNLLKKYTVGIVTVFLSRDIFKDYSFDNKFDIIGDFDLILRLSETKKIGYIHDTLAVYRLHNSNLSKKRIALHANEMQGWIRENKNIFKNKKNFKYLKLYLIKLKLKILFRFLL